MSSSKTVVICYGKGGHKEQANRVVSKLNKLEEFNNQGKITLISISDDSIEPEWSEHHEVMAELRDKHTGKLNNPIKYLSILRSLKKNYRPDVIINTGPGLSIVCSLYFKFFCSTKVVHIETWSRFQTKSFTGRFMYIISDKFYVQNQELLSKYPNSKYSGRL